MFINSLDPESMKLKVPVMQSEMDVFYPLSIPEIVKEVKAEGLTLPYCITHGKRSALVDFIVKLTSPKVIEALEAAAKSKEACSTSKKQVERPLVDEASERHHERHHMAYQYEQMPFDSGKEQEESASQNEHRN